MDGEIIKICKDGKYEFMTSMDEQNHGTALKQGEEIQLTRKPEIKSKKQTAPITLSPPLALKSSPVRKHLPLANQQNIQ